MIRFETSCNKHTNIQTKWSPPTPTSDSSNLPEGWTLTTVQIKWLLPFLWLWWWPKTCMKGHQGQFLKQSDNNITFTFTIMVPHCDWIYSPLSSVASQPCSLIDAHASAWGKEISQLQPVQILNHWSFSSEMPHAGSQWRKAFCLQTVQLRLHTS